MCVAFCLMVMLSHCDLLLPNISHLQKMTVYFATTSDERITEGNRDY